MWSSATTFVMVTGLISISKSLRTLPSSFDWRMDSQHAWLAHSPGSICQSHSLVTTTTTTSRHLVSSSYDPRPRYLGLVHYHAALAGAERCIEAARQAA